MIQIETIQQQHVITLQSYQYQQTFFKETSLVVLDNHIVEELLGFFLISRRSATEESEKQLRRWKAVP